jgi:FAD/FMN-containing dehydrogenase
VLRGGGGNFGVVTAMEFRLFPYGEVYAGMMLWDYERHAEVLRGWRDWTRTAPEDVTTSFRIMHLPPLPELPPFLAGRSVVVIDGAYAGGADGGAAALAALRALEPEMDTWAPATPAVLSRIHMDPEEPVPARSQSMMLGTLDDAALDAFVAPIRPGAPVLFGELRHLGGALARIPEAAGAIGRLDGEYLMFAAGIVPAPELADPVGRALLALKASLAAYDTGTGFPNFVEEPTDAATFYAEDAYARLREIRAAVDPADRMVGNHPIPA